MFRKLVMLLIFVIVILFFFTSCSRNVSNKAVKNALKTLSPIIKNISIKGQKNLREQIDEHMRPIIYSSPIPLRIKKENKEYAALKQYADNNKSLEIKWKQLQEINRSRAKYRQQPLILDIHACRVANMHCQDMIKNKYFSHYSLDGKKPYHRWGLSGGLDHVGENLHSRSQNVRLKTSYNDIFKYMRIGHKRFMEERPPNDGHRKEILYPYHTHIGIGYAIKDGEFRYAELFVDRYLKIDRLHKRITKRTFTVKGKVLRPRRYGIYMTIVYYDPFKRRLSKKVRSSPYPDYSKIKLAQIAPWKMHYNIKTGRFSIPIKLRKHKKGYAYIQIYVKPNPRNIPYRPRGRVIVDTKYAICAGGLVVTLE